MAKYLGIIDHFYARPLFLRLSERYRASPFDFELLIDSPAQLAIKLREGQLNGAFLTPIDYARNYDKYKIIPRFCIYSRGESSTIELIFNENLRSIKTLAVDPNSTSEIVLANIVLMEKYNISPQIIPVTVSPEDALKNNDAVLIVKKSLPTEDEPINRLDIVDEWTDLTGHPYIHGMWAAHLDGLTPPEIRYIIHKTNEGIQSLDSGEWDDANWYFKNFDYDFSDEIKNALLEFFQMAYYHGTLNDLPSIKFFHLGEDEFLTTEN